MSSTLKPIPFFCDTITIIPHTATDAFALSRRVTIREFAAGQPVSLSEVMENQEFFVKRQDGAFMQGKEVE